MTIILNNSIKKTPNVLVFPWGVVRVHQPAVLTPCSLLLRSFSPIFEVLYLSLQHKFTHIIFLNLTRANHFPLFLL